MEEYFKYQENVSVENKLPDPFRCRLDLRPRPGEAGSLKRVFRPLLQWLDPVFQFVTINDNKTRLNKHLISPNTPEHSSRCSPDNVNTPAMSIMLFLLEDHQGEHSAASALNNLQKPPFRFHHKIELSSKNCRGNIKTVARQDFYIASPEYPLISVCPVHYGKEHLRFNIFAKNFEAMVDFYRCILGMQASSTKPGFCLFNVYSQPGFDIQVALKHSSKLTPRPVKAGFLRIKVKYARDLQPFLSGQITKVDSSGELITHDPDGNVVILEETELPANGDIVNNHEVDDLDLDDVCSMFSVDLAEDTKSELSFSGSYDSGACSLDAADGTNTSGSSADSAIYDSSAEELQFDELFKLGRRKTTPVSDNTSELIVVASTTV